MKTVMDYTMQDTKTLWQGQSLVSGINCRPESVYDNFLSTKLLYHKDSGTLFFHMVQSFPKGEQVDPVTAHAAAMKLAEYFEGREVLVCTHVDREHIHSHFIINSVSLEDGKKLHMSDHQIRELHQRNDQICMEFGLPVFQKAQRRKKIKAMSIAEYHIAARGNSWKFRLINTIDDCMKYAHNKDEFIFLMQTEGYQVRWEDSRQNITYTTPSGMKCRDDRLHDEKYLKEAMGLEFRIRAAIIHGGIEADEYAETYAVGTGHAGNNGAYGTEGTRSDDGVARADAGGASDTSYQAGVDGNANSPRRAEPPLGGTDGPCAGAVRAGEYTPDLGADLGAGAGCGGGTGNARTGWEAEREILFSAPHPTTAPTPSTPVPGAAAHSSDLTGGLGSVVELGHALERNQNAPPVRDATTMPTHHERGKKRKLALGQREDDHEKEQTWQQTM